MADLRLNPCPACGGDCGWEEARGYGFDGAPDSEWVTCEECGGEGSIEVDLVAVSLDEADELERAP